MVGLVWSEDQTDLVVVDGLPDDPVMAGQRQTHRIRRRFPQTRRPFDIGEQETSPFPTVQPPA